MGKIIKDIAGKNRINKNAVYCSSCFAPQFIKFNFTFLNPKCIPADVSKKAEVLDRIIYLSNFTVVQLCNMSKTSGFETIPRDQIKEFAGKPYEKDNDHRFEEGHRKLSEKCYIIRLNNSSTTRFIGELIKNIFYVFCIDFTGKAYKH